MNANKVRGNTQKKKKVFMSVGIVKYKVWGRLLTHKVTDNNVKIK